MPWRLGWLLGVVMVAASCTESAPQAEAELYPAQEVQEMLTARADALAAGDVTGFLEPLDGPAREVEEALAVQATAVPLSEIRLLLRDAAFTQEEVDGRTVTAASKAKVDFVFHYEGIPEDNPFGFRLLYDLQQRDGSWRVTDVELVFPDMETPVPMPPMWALGPVEVARSEHVLALFRPGLANAQEVLAMAEQARAAVLPQIDLEIAPAEVLQLAATDEEYLEIVGEMNMGSVALARLEFPDAAYSQSRVPEGRHISVNLQAVFAAALPPELVGDPEAEHDMAGGEPHGHLYDPEVTPAQVFQHEVGHLALGRHTRPSTPVWVAEGAAMLLAGEQRRTSWRQGLDDGTFDELTFRDIVRRGPGRGLGYMEYAYVNAAVSWLVQEYGVEQFWVFYRDFKEFQMGSAGTPLEQVHADGSNRLLRRIYDIDEQDLDAAARAWIRQALP